MSSRKVSFADVVGETEAEYKAAQSEILKRKKLEEQEARARAARQQREQERVRAEYAREQAKKLEEAQKKKKEDTEANERLKLELQIALYREQYPTYEIPKTTEKTPLSKLREIKKQVEAKNALNFMPPLLHTFSGVLVKFYVHMVEEMGMNPLDHEVQDLQAFYMSQAARQIMLPAWKATVAANPWLIGGNPWWMQVLMGFYLVAESNSQRVKAIRSASAYEAPPEEDREAPPTMRPGSSRVPRSGVSPGIRLRETLLNLNREEGPSDPVGKGKGPA